MSEALKPCPFCGTLLIQIGSGPHQHWMHPRNHEACLLSMRPVWEEHAAKWNRRADLAGLPEELVEQSKAVIDLAEAAADGVTMSSLLLRKILEWNQRAKEAGK